VVLYQAANCFRVEKTAIRHRFLTANILDHIPQFFPEPLSHRNIETMLRLLKNSSRQKIRKGLLENPFRRASTQFEMSGQ